MSSTAAPRDHTISTQTTDVREYLRVLRSRKWSVILVVLLALGAVGIYVARAARLYTAATRDCRSAASVRGQRQPAPSRCTGGDSRPGTSRTAHSAAPFRASADRQTPGGAPSAGAGAGGAR